MYGNFKLFRFLLQMIYYGTVTVSLNILYYVGIYITTRRGVPIPTNLGVGHNL